MNYQVWLALVVVIATVWALIKRYDTMLTLLIGGLALCCVSLDPMMAFRQFDKSMTTKTGQRDLGIDLAQKRTSY